jgi:hypothetical protein
MKVKEKKKLRIYCAECLNFKDQCFCLDKKEIKKKDIFIKKKRKKKTRISVCYVGINRKGIAMALIKKTNGVVIGFV